MGCNASSPSEPVPAAKPAVSESTLKAGQVSAAWTEQKKSSSASANNNAITSSSANNKAVSTASTNAAPKMSSAPGYDAAPSLAATSAIAGYDVAQTETTSYTYVNASSNASNTTGYDGAPAYHKSGYGTDHSYHQVGNAPVEEDAEADKLLEFHADQKVIDRLGSYNLNRDWNAEFQAIFEAPNATPYERDTNQKNLDNLMKAFVSFAESTVKLLVAEKNVPVSEKTIKPLDRRGIAGGEKYLVGKVFVKYAWDDKGVYGSDDRAQKAAMNEIRSSNALLECRLSLLHTSLQAVFRWCGHAVIVTALMPITHKSLVYGSDNAAMTIMDSNRQMRDIVSRAAQRLNLKTHKVRSKTDGREVEMFVAVDCEGHMSRKDGRFYFIDLGRLIPPNSGKGQEIFCFQFRSEYLRERASSGRPPLSSDAFTTFGLIDRDANDKEVQEAIRDLEQVQVPKLPSALLRAYGETVHGGKEAALTRFCDPLPTIAELFHQRGINLRYLGQVFALLNPQSTALSEKEHAAKTLSSVRLAVLEEMIVRAFKGYLRRQLRSAQGEPACQEAAATALHSILGSSARANEFWTSRITELLKEKYGVSADTVTQAELATARKELLSDSILHYMLTELGLNIYNSTSGMNVLDWSKKEGPATAVRIQITSNVVKPPDFGSIESAEERYLNELSIREKALGENNPELLSTLRALLTVYQNWNEVSPEHTLKKGESIVSRCVSIAEANPMTDEAAQAYTQAALFYWNFNLYAKAEPLVRSCLNIREQLHGDSDANTARTTGFMASLLETMGRYAEAKPYYERALALKEKLLGAEHLDVALECGNFAALHQSLGNWAEAEKLRRREIAIKEKHGDPNDPSLGASLNNLGGLLRMTGRVNESEPFYRRSLAIKAKALGDEHPDTAVSICNLGQLLEAQGKHSESEELYKKALAIHEKTLVDAHADKANSYLCLGAHYFNRGRVADSLPYMEKSMYLNELVFGKGHKYVKGNAGWLASTYDKLGRSADAARVRRENNL